MIIRKFQSILREERIIIFLLPSGLGIYLGKDPSTAPILNHLLIRKLILIFAMNARKKDTCVESALS